MIFFPSSTRHQPMLLVPMSSPSVRAMMWMFGGSVALSTFVPRAYHDKDYSTGLLTSAPVPPGLFFCGSATSGAWVMATLLSKPEQNLYGREVVTKYSLNRWHVLASAEPAEHICHLSLSQAAPPPCARLRQVPYFLPAAYRLVLHLNDHPGKGPRSDPRVRRSSQPVRLRAVPLVLTGAGCSHRKFPT